MKIIVNKGNCIPQIKVKPCNRYFVRLNDKIIISPLPIGNILEKLGNLKFNINGDENFQGIYDIEKAIALEDFVIEEEIK